MQCAQCGKTIIDPKVIKVQGNSFCNNLCRYSYEKAHGTSIGQLPRSKSEKNNQGGKSYSGVTTIGNQTIVKKKEHVLWKVYFWFLIIMGFFAYIGQGFNRFWEVFDCLYFVGSMVGLYGFCWQKKIFSKPFWGIYFWSCLIWNILYQFVFPMLPQYHEIFRVGTRGFIFSVVNCVLFIPLVIGLFRYAFRRNELWNKK
jgi:hypothetical protein